MQVSRIIQNFNYLYIKIFYFRNGLKPNGLIVLKENVSGTYGFQLDEKDSSLIRSMDLFRKIFELANLDCYRVLKQNHFPKELFSVFMFVLKPRPIGQKPYLPEGEAEKINIPQYKRPLVTIEDLCY